MGVVEAILLLLTGMGVFLVGVNMLSASLRKNSTQRMHKMFKKIGDNRFSGLALGTGVTGIIQSSTAVTVMTVGLVGAGVMSLFQATAIIMGANIGTTFTNILVGLSFLNIVRPILMSLVFVGIVIKLVSKKEKAKVVANVLISIGILFVGMRLMSSVFDRSIEDPIPAFFSNMFKTVGSWPLAPLLLVLLGGLFTIILQSSTAAMGIYLVMASTGVLPLEAGLYLILGKEMGTCFTAILASLSGNREAKRAAMIHLLYNVFGTLLFLIIIWPFQGPVIGAYSRLMGGNQMWAMAVFPLINNLVSVAILIWFIKPFNRLVCWMIKDKPDPEESVIANFTNPRLLETPPFAIAQTIKGLNYIGQKAKDNLEAAFTAVIGGDTSGHEKIEKEEASINSITQSLADYLVKISSTYISAHNQKLAAGLHHVLSDMERIGDQAITLLNSATRKADSGIKFSPEADAELTKMFERVMSLFNVGLCSDFQNNWQKARAENQRLKEEIDAIKEEIADTHIKRLQEGRCASGAAEYYYAVITSLKSVTEHLLNIDKNLSRLSRKKPNGNGNKQLKPAKKLI